MIILDLTKGVSETDQYKAFKFPGGEIHLKFKIDFSEMESNFLINTRLNSSDDIIFLMIAVDTLKKDWPEKRIDVYIPYVPYQQADRDFSVGECFSLVTVANMLCSISVDVYHIYDPHSDQSAGFLKMGGKKVHVIDNSGFINWIVNDPLPIKNLVMLSPDAGAYKKIYKLAEKINFQGEVASANKSRSISTGNIDSIELSKQDFEGKDVLIVDDICIGGRTFIELAKKLKGRNAGDLYLAVSHGIFSNGFSELSKYFKTIFTTNSRKDSYELGELGVRYNQYTFAPEVIDHNFLQVHNII